MEEKQKRKALRIVRAAAGDNGLRADLFVCRELGGVPRRRINRLFAEKAVKIGGRCVPKGALLAAGDRVEFPAEALSEDSVIPDPRVGFEVVFENGLFAVVEKPAGIPSHPNLPGETGTLASGLVHRWPALARVGNKPFEPGMVHRLDNGTSGLMIVALTPGSFTFLRRAFSSGAIRKEYLAVVEGEAPRSGGVDRPLAHDARDDRIMRVSGERGAGCRGKSWPAATAFNLVSRHGAYSLVKVSIKGGVMHQIRAHMAFLGLPVVGDTLYGSKVKIGGGGEFLLHASKLDFTGPGAGERHKFISGPPSRFGLFLSKHG